MSRAGTGHTPGPIVTRLDDLSPEVRARVVFQGYIARIDWPNAGRWARSEAEIADYLANGPQVKPCAS